MKTEVQRIACIITRVYQVARLREAKDRIGRANGYVKIDKNVRAVMECWNYWSRFFKTKLIVRLLRMCACLCVWLCLFILCFVSLKWTNPPGSNKWVLTLFRVSNNVTTTYLFNRIYVLCLKVDSVFMLKVLLLFLLFYLYWYSDSPSFVSFLEFIVTAWLLFEKVGIMCDQKLKVVLIFWISPEWWDQWFSLVHFQSSLPSRSSMCKSRIRFSSARNWQRALAITKKK